MVKVDLRKLYKPTDKQIIAHTVSERFVLFGGAVGGGKSYWLCREAIELSLECSGNVGYLCRHELSSFMRTTMLTMEREIDTGDEPNIIGQDIARFGDDSSVACIRKGNKAFWLDHWAKTNLMHTTGKIVNLIDKFKPSLVNLDIIGLGSGVYDRLIELKYKQANPINVQEKARGEDKEKFSNLRAEIYKNLSNKFENGEISIPDDLELIAQLSSIKYKINSRGQLQMESKEDMKKRGTKSPDKADALALAFMDSPLVEARVRWL